MTRHSRIVATVTRKRLAVLLVAAAFATATALAGVALATPGSGVTSVVMARGAFVDATDLKFKVTGPMGQEVIHVPNAQESVVQRITIVPGGQTGWHTHPGPVIVIVAAGTLTFYGDDDPTCTGRVYTAGQSFIDRGQGHVHIGRNEGSQNLELWSLYLDVPPGASNRIDAPAPGNCSF